MRDHLQARYSWTKCYGRLRSPTGVCDFQAPAEEKPPDRSTWKCANLITLVKLPKLYRNYWNLFASGGSPDRWNYMLMSLFHAYFTLPCLILPYLTVFLERFYRPNPCILICRHDGSINRRSRLCQLLYQTVNTSHSSQYLKSTLQKKNCVGLWLMNG